MIHQLIAALGTELGLTGEEISEVIWLALQMHQADGYSPPTPFPLEEYLFK